jgi:uncharacterized protein
MNMGKLAALIVSGVMLCLPAAQAQPPAAPALATEMPSDAQVAAAMDLLKANHTIDNLNATLDTLAPLQRAQIKRQLPALSDDAVAALIQSIRGAIRARQDELLHLHAIEYARHFSEQELRDLSAFYRSELGQKYISQLPALIKESSPMAIRWVTAVLAEEQQRILDSLPKQDKKT